MTVPPLRRSRSDRIVAGVAGGIAAHTRVSPAIVRLAFVALLAWNGIGAVIYAIYWAVVKDDVEGPPVERDRRRVLSYVALTICVVLGVYFLLHSDTMAAATGLLIALVAVGAGVIWHQADPGRARSTWIGRALGERDRPAFVVRFIGGAILVSVGVIGVALINWPLKGGGPDTSSLITALVFTLVALAGVGVVVAPMLWRTFGALRSEREGRIREQERAELAAMIHDQVLHTLALIQRNAGDVATVTRLARGQERSLRSWLYKPTGSAEEFFAAGIEQAAAEVEDTYAIVVETVVVGDRKVDEHTAALVAATREALVNAARHAKVTTVALYAEVEPTEISVFVRDRGVGFDMSTVEEHRHGVRGSIVGRMARHGGKAEIRSEPGEGTEVRLTLPTKENS
ncbi:ATP-binding protein [Allocatelliglobosispora scoriae]|uniref:ATP-binding protein n=1 Tax=Allocatelliglobosispora scoriae TaxID=643052 RepID=UPI00160BD624|nr:ATP-binding protein [Allocatelliglobosispora scoriae]